VLVLDVLEVLLAQVVHGDALGELIAEQRACRSTVVPRPRVS
jgi:hypothetical protein